jgi:hypothetical protein
MTFSQPNSFKLIVNHGEKFFYILVIIGVIFTFEDLKGRFLVDVLFIIAISYLILFIFGKFLKKVAWRIDIDFSDKEFVFYLCRTNRIEKVKFDQVEEIKVSGPVLFLYNKKKIYYSTAQYLELLPQLNQIKKLKWGKMVDLLGPDKETRAQIEQTR